MTGCWWPCCDGGNYNLRQYHRDGTIEWSQAILGSQTVGKLLVNGADYLVAFGTVGFMANSAAVRVARYTPSASGVTLVWERDQAFFTAIHGGAYKYLTDIHIDLAGDVIVVGRSTLTTSFAIMKLSGADGTLQWVRPLWHSGTFNTFTQAFSTSGITQIIPGNNGVDGVCTDVSNNIYIGHNPVMDPLVISNPHGSSYNYWGNITKLTSAGADVWMSTTHQTPPTTTTKPGTIRTITCGQTKTDLICGLIISSNSGQAGQYALVKVDRSTSDVAWSALRVNTSPSVAASWILSGLIVSGSHAVVYVWDAGNTSGITLQSYTVSAGVKIFEATTGDANINSQISNKPAAGGMALFNTINTANDTGQMWSESPFGSGIFVLTHPASYAYGGTMRCISDLVTASSITGGVIAGGELVMP